MKNSLNVTQKSEYNSRSQLEESKHSFKERKKKSGKNLESDALLISKNKPRHGALPPLHKNVSKDISRMGDETLSMLSK